MPRRDKHGRTAESYRAEAEILGAKLPKGADLAAMRKAVIDRGRQNLRHNVARNPKNPAVGAEKCGGCH